MNSNKQFLSPWRFYAVLAAALALQACAEAPPAKTAKVRPPPPPHIQIGVLVKLGPKMSALQPEALVPAVSSVTQTSVSDAGRQEDGRHKFVVSCTARPQCLAGIQRLRDQPEEFANLQEVSMPAFGP